MWTERSDTEKAEGSASASRTVTDQQISELSEKNLERSIKSGVNAPFARVMLRLLLAVLIVSSLIMFITGVMRYNELMREKEVLENKRDSISNEIEELRYLVDCPVDYDYIVRVAREKMNLHLPDEIVYYNDYNDAD